MRSVSYGTTATTVSCRWRGLRRTCACNVCKGYLKGTIPEAGQRLKQFSRLGENGVFIAWVDGHETLYTTADLRSLCRCAYCAGEPEKPITGG